MKRVLALFLALSLCLGLCACAPSTDEQPAKETAEVTAEEVAMDAVPDMEELYTDRHEMQPLQPAEVLAMEDSAPARWTLLDAEATGVLTYENEEAIVDYSNTGDGYVMVKYIGDTSSKLKARIYGPTTMFTYNLTPGEWEVFPLSDGNGTYNVTVYCGIGGSKYANMLTLDFEVAMEDEFAPFLRPNQYVDFMVAPKSIEKAAELIGGIPDNLEKVKVVYDFVVDNFVYDDYKAATVKSGYLPVLDEVLEERKGICFDYAALMAGMLRSQGVPCKLIVGYAGAAYHAWISVWTEEFGWIDGAIYFDGTTWHRMDPTFASSARRSDYVMEFINNDNNYSTKYSY